MGLSDQVEETLPRILAADAGTATSTANIHNKGDGSKRHHPQEGTTTYVTLDKVDYLGAVTSRLDSSVLCILEPQLCVHWLLPYTWQLRDSQGVPLQLLYWSRGVQATNYKTLVLAADAVAERFARSPPNKARRVQCPAWSPDFRKWESCRTMPLVAGFSQGSPVSPTPSFRLRSIFPSITLIDSQNIAVKSRTNLFNSLHLSWHKCKYSINRLAEQINFTYAKCTRTRWEIGALRLFLEKIAIPLPMLAMSNSTTSVAALCGWVRELSGSIRASTFQASVQTRLLRPWSRLTIRRPAVATKKFYTVQRSQQRPRRILAVLEGEQILRMLVSRHANRIMSYHLVQRNNLLQGAGGVFVLYLNCRWFLRSLTTARPAYTALHSNVCTQYDEETARRFNALRRPWFLDLQHAKYLVCAQMWCVVPLVQFSRFGRDSGGVVVRVLASRLGEPGLIPGGAALRFSHVRVVPDDAGFSRGSPFSPDNAFRHTHLASPSSGSQDPDLSLYNWLSFVCTELEFAAHASVAPLYQRVFCDTGDAEDDDDVRVSRVRTTETLKRSDSSSKLPPPPPSPTPHTSGRLGTLPALARATRDNGQKQFPPPHSFSSPGNNLVEAARRHLAPSYHLPHAFQLTPSEVPKVMRHLHICYHVDPLLGRLAATRRDDDSTSGRNTCGEMLAHAVWLQLHHSSLQDLGYEWSSPPRPINA
ncbi:hypothetical protein PR048_007804 [Dryococelus australis]|uniref:Uncharacterized protein n=1 Tax=Dryococelus australis TaxID=614101 RepID=A0ABQ9HVA8_9NEOP|nr:hypothetical protein PR048_007804 [Dryococelus australis]